MGPRELRFKAFSSAYDFFGVQYPHQSSNGRRELRAMEKDAASSPRINGASSSHDRSRSKVNSVDTAIHIPSTGTPSDGFDYQNDDFQKRYSARRTATQSEGGFHQRKNSKSPHGEHIPTSPDFNDMDDGTGQPAAPADFSKRGIHIPTRTRYVSALFCLRSSLSLRSILALILTVSHQQQRQAKACAAAISSPTFEIPCRSRRPELLAAFTRNNR